MIRINTSKMTDTINMIIDDDMENIHKQLKRFLSSRDKNSLYDAIIEKEELEKLKYIEKLQEESEASEGNKQLSFSFNENKDKQKSYGINCKKCNEHYPYAEVCDNFICWSCKNF